MSGEDLLLEARFIKLYLITVRKNYDDAPDATYEESSFEGTSVTVTAGESNGFYRFVGWYLDGELVSSELEYSFEMPAGDVSLEVRYIKLYRVEAFIDREGDLTGKLDTTFASGEQVTLVAERLDGYRFVGWYSDDALISDSLELVFAMPECDTIYTARYVKLYTINAVANYPEVMVSGSGEYVRGDIVNLSADKSNERYVFDGWYLGGERVSENAVYSLTVSDENINIEARYIKRYKVSFIGNGVLVTGGGFYFENETVTVSAKAKAGYRFDGWYIGENLLSTDSEYSFVMSNEDVEITLDVFVIWDGQMSDGFSGGSGTQNDPYLISHASELKYLAYLVNEVGTQSGYYKLISDIDIAGHEWEPIGSRYAGTNQNAFSGHFDGNGKTIYNFNITSVNSATSYIGLFGGVCGNIINLNVSDFNIELQIQTDTRYVLYVGGIVAYNDYKGNLDNCKANGRININITDSSYSIVNAGLAAGSLTNVIVECCSARGEINVNFNRSENNSSTYNSTVSVGGFAAVINGSKSSYQPVKAYANANICIDTNESSSVSVNVGGFVSNVIGASKCYAEADINVVSGGLINVGGLASSTRYSVSSSYSTGEIRVKSGSNEVNVGGLVAKIGKDGGVNACYSACDIFVEGSKESTAVVTVGGLAAQKEWSTYDGNNNIVPGCIAFGDITVIARKCIVYTLFKEFDKTPYGSYVYEGQKINVTATMQTIYQGTNVATSSQANNQNNQKFYTEKLNFSSLDWNLSELDVENGKYPVLKNMKKYNVSITGAGAEIVGNGYYLEGTKVTVSAETNTGYRFEGWYIGGELVSVESEYSFTMPSEDVEITLAVFEIWSGEAAECFAGGSGTVEDPYIISNASELKYLAYLVNKVGTQNGHYKLIADIDMGGREWQPIGYNYKNSGFANNSFAGTFDGNGYTVKNFKITANNPQLLYVGLFGGVSGTIKNLTVSDFEIELSTYCSGRMIGGIAAYVDGGKLSGCFANGKIILSDTAEASNYSSSMYFGMIAGYLNGGEIIKCKSSGELCVSVANGMTSAFIGGVLGGNKGNIQYCGTDASISLIATAEALVTSVGGVVGTNLSQGSVENCYTYAEIECDLLGQGYVGGIAAISNFGIYDCFAGGSIYVKFDTAGAIIGGVVGNHQSTARRVERCFSVTDITVDASPEFVSTSSKFSVGCIAGKASYDVINCVAANDITVNGTYAYITRIPAKQSNCYYYSGQKITLSIGGSDGQYGTAIALKVMNDKAFYQSLGFGEFDLSELDFENGKYPTLIIPE